MPLPKKYRLPLRLERNRINKTGLPLSGRYLTVIVGVQNEVLPPRFAILVSKKVSPFAVQRNRLRRQISEFITPLTPLLASKGYLIIPKKTALGTESALLKQDLLNTLNVKFIV